ncbi:MAG: glutaredoxin family protein [Candidatus Aenigmatarchaeota archaeon]|nr:glutaredoxin family protein [Candidatus Aenigmarchaeota archaeon]
MPKVRIYTTTSCPYCTMAKDFLKKNKVLFEEINIEKDHKLAREIVEKTGQTGVPVIEIDGKIILGFDKAALKKALKIK